MRLGGDESMIEVMQRYLPSLRKIAGWTAEELGKRLGVTKQTISNLENKKVNMTKMQYIALRVIFENEIRNVATNATLKRAICILFYNDAVYTEKKEVEIFQALESLAAAASGGISGNQLTLLSTTVLAPLRLNIGVNADMDLKRIEPYEWVQELTNVEEK